MHLTFSFLDGRRMEGILLTIGIDHMRVALSGWEDAVEFRRMQGYWAAEDGERIELESLIELESVVMNSESDSDAIAEERPLVTPARVLAESLDSIGEFSTERYRPIMRLDDRSDLSFLGSLPSVTRKTAARLRKEHCRVFRAYLRYLQTDFQTVRRAIKILMLESQTDRPDLAALLLRSQFAFACGLLKVQLRVTLYSHGIGTVSVGDLLKRLDQMSLELRDLIPIAVTNVVTSEP
jgi:hypothetical protein